MKYLIGLQRDNNDLRLIMQHFHSRASVSTNSEDIDDVIFNSPEMRFSGVLDISIWTLTMESMFHFFGSRTLVPSHP